jgi:hypothetical protein
MTTQALLVLCKCLKHSIYYRLRIILIQSNEFPSLSPSFLLFLLPKSIGFLVGLVLSSILMSVVASAVLTIIVCFVEAPAEFQANHPQLSNEMRAAWREAWPHESGRL